MLDERLRTLDERLRTLDEGLRTRDEGPGTDVEAPMLARACRQVVFVTLCAGFPVAVQAQSTWQPAAPPTVTAENESWYQTGEPIQWSDDYYYRAGAAVFFNRYQMARAGSYRGIPVYTDGTADPFGIIYVPVANGLMQPYERKRRGALAGTTGNRAPSFPTSIAAEGITDTGAVAPGPPNPSWELEAVATTGRSIVEAPRAEIGSVPRPKGINGVWVEFDGRRWFSVGKAILLNQEFKQAGSVHNFPVYRRTSEPDRIYVPTSDGMVAPYAQRNAGPAVKR
jgi:hypothetical protein